MNTIMPADHAAKREKYDGVHKQELAQAAEYLFRSLDWSASIEGYNYWANIYDRLIELSGRESKWPTKQDLPKP
jgi:hypothetical protein